MWPVPSKMLVTRLSTGCRFLQGNGMSGDDRRLKKHFNPLKISTVFSRIPHAGRVHVSSPRQFSFTEWGKFRHDAEETGLHSGAASKPCALDRLAVCPAGQTI